MKIKSIAVLIVWLSAFLAVILGSGYVGRPLIDSIGLQEYQILLLLTIVQIAFSALILPCSPVTLVTGWYFGFWCGLVLSTLFTILSVIVTFCLCNYLPSRFLFRSALEAISCKIRKNFSSLHPLSVIVILQFNPVFPGSSLGYVYKYLNFKLPIVILGTAIGTSLPQLAIIGIGSNLEDASNYGKLPVFLVFVALYFLLTFIVPRLFKYFGYALK